MNDGTSTSFSPVTKARLKSQGIRVGKTTIKPCWGCRDKGAYDAEKASPPPPGYAYHPYWHPWHDGKTEMREWLWIQRFAFRLGWWKPECLCRACNGTGNCLCTEMSHA